MMDSFIRYDSITINGMLFVHFFNSINIMETDGVPCAADHSTDTFPWAG